MKPNIPIYYALTTQKDIITGKHESLSPITKETFQGTVYAGQTVIPLSGNPQVQIGSHIGEYAKDWTLKPLSERVAAGYVTLKEGYVLDGDDVRQMTQEERIKEGLEQPPPKPSAEELAQMRRGELKDALAALDYKIIKCYEYSLMGLPLPYDIEQLHAQRQAMRDEINSLRENPS